MFGASGNWALSELWKVCCHIWILHHKLLSEVWAMQPGDMFRCNCKEPTSSASNGMCFMSERSFWNAQIAKPQVTYQVQPATVFVAVWHHASNFLWPTNGQTKGTRDTFFQIWRVAWPPSIVIHCLNWSFLAPKWASSRLRKPSRVTRHATRSDGWHAVSRALRVGTMPFVKNWRIPIDRP